LSGVGVPDERGAGQVAPAPSLVRPMVGDVFQPLFEDRDLAPDRTAIGLELGLPRPAEPDTPADPREVCPHTGEARQQILELAKFVEVGFHLSSVRRALPRRPDEKGPLHGRLNFDERSDASKPPSSNRIYSIKILRPSFT